MRITSLNLTLGKEDGLGESILSPLGELVVLAGPNGAGKSRILSLVRRLLSDGKLRPAKVDGYRTALASRAGEDNATITMMQQAVDRASMVNFSAYSDVGMVVDFFPKTPHLADHRQLNESQQRRAVAEVSTSNDLSNLHDQTLAYLAAVERRWFSATHPLSTLDSTAKDLATLDHEQLGNLVEDLLGVRPLMDIDQQVTLFGRTIPETKLSDGQRILLQVAVALHAKGKKLGSLVLLLDEPESHLHPSAVIHAIEKLRSLNRDGQIWLATHCIPILAAMPTESIWYVKDAKASWAGRRPEAVIEGLLGGASGRERMEEFLRLPAQFASSRFAAECLLPPAAVTTGLDDPQATQIRAFCERAGNGDKPLRVLDFGAGHGRRVAALKERWQAAGSFCDTVDYRAFEPMSADTTVLRSNVASAYNDDVPRVFTRDDELVRLDDHSVHVVILCNVLHELPPEQWKDLFGSGSRLSRLLKPDGHVLVLEDMELPHGEKAHRFGFLLLDNPHLYKLLECTEKDSADLLTLSVRGERLKIHAISARLLGRTTMSSIVASLKLLKETARTQVLSLRAKDVNSRNGRLHALWTQQLANADLGIHALE